LNSKSFWYATEDVVNEAALREVRAAKSVLASALTTGVIDDDEMKTASEILTGAIDDHQLNSWTY
jgi:hypothetical protein